MLDEAPAPACRAVLSKPEPKLISAGTLTEFLIVATRRGVETLARRLVEASALDVEIVTRERAEEAADAYRQWGKGFHAAHLNYGDCFAYALAQEFGCPLLYVGDDFARTDVRSALG